MSSDDISPVLPDYNQPAKKEIRRRILNHAVTALTAARKESPVVTTDQFFRMLEYCRRFILKHLHRDIQPHIERKAGE